MRDELSDDALRWCARLEALSFKIKHRDFTDYTQLLVDLESAQSLLIDALSASVKAEREKIEAIIAVIRDEYGGHVIDSFVEDLHKRLKQRLKQHHGQRGEK